MIRTRWHPLLLASLILISLIRDTLPWSFKSLSSHRVQQPEQLIDPRDSKAFPLQTPHSGRHFIPSHPAYSKQRQRALFKKRNTRFTEGWYYRLTLPESNASFAFIISIEDPGHTPVKSDLRLACIQVIGPNDGYITQVDRDDSKFWAWKRQQGLGCNFQYKPGYDRGVLDTRAALPPDVWRETVESGFQILPLHWLGRIQGRDGTLGGLFDRDDDESPRINCDFDFQVEPICGWGDADGEQKSTGGWLASFSVFEPHWQVTLADARATGTVQWNGSVYNFTDAPFYAEKNWGAALPVKWYWTQCNSFDGYDQLSVTAGGGIRKLPLGQTESLGMVSVHYNGIFYEAVPWSGTMQWKVSKWGSWILEGQCTVGDRPFEVSIEYTCDPDVEPGLVFRAPTPDQGMVRFCRDTFQAQATLTLWELTYNPSTQSFERSSVIIDRATSSQGGAEIGGGPWWDEWQGVSRLQKPIRALLRWPIRLGNLRRRLRRGRSK